MAHRFEARGLSAADLAITTPGITDFSGVVTVLVDDDAHLLGMEVKSTYRQPVGGSSQPVSMTITFSGTGKTATVEPPADPWKTYTSRSGFSIAYPAAMTPYADSGAEGLAFSATDFVALGREPQPKGVKLGDYAAAYALSWKQQKHVKPEEVSNTTIGGLPGVVMTFHATLGGPEYVITGVTLKGRNGYFIALATAAGNEVQARALFDEMIATFKLTS